MEKDTNPAAGSGAPQLPETDDTTKPGAPFMAGAPAASDGAVPAGDASVQATVPLPTTTPEAAPVVTATPIASAIPVNPTIPQVPELPLAAVAVSSEPDAAKSEIIVPSATVPVAKPWRKRPLFWVVIATVLIAAGLAAFIALRPSTAPAAVTQTPSTKKQIKRLGAVLSVADGTVEASADNKVWKTVAAGDPLRPGTYVRAAAGGRAVVTLDDGSAVRIASASTARLASLNADDVMIVNVSGEVYTRVVASERKFSVVVDNEAYVALGTAYKTLNTDQSKGVEVYHSQVKTTIASETIAEGKRYYQSIAQPELVKKVTDIPLDSLQKDAFLQWNLEQDKQSSDFQDKLGYLEKMAAAPKAVTVAAPTPQPAAAASGITLAASKYDSGVTLGWRLAGVTAPKGFKILRSLTANPVHGKAEAAYVGSASSRSYNWKIKDGKTYHFRVCVYTGDSCANYSNDVTITAPLVAEAKPAGSISLQHSGSDGKTVHWSVTGGSALYGYKLVWSANPNPTYGEAGTTPIYYDGKATSGNVDASGKTYVRVCMFYDGQCLNYSNEISPTL